MTTQEVLGFVEERPTPEAENNELQKFPNALPLASAEEGTKDSLDILKLDHMSPKRQLPVH